MTIAAGILCPDGIILCADSEESLGTFKRNRPKLIELQLASSDVKCVAVGAASDASFMDALLDKVSDAIEKTDSYSAQIQQAIETAVLNYCTKIWKLYPTIEDRPTADILIGMRVTDGLSLICIQTPIVRSISTSEFIGWGYELASYKSKQMLLSELPTAISASLAAYILDVVKRNSKYCGGPTKMAVIHKDGTVERKSQTEIDKAARVFTSLSMLLDAFVLPILPLVTDAEGRDLLSALSEAVVGEPEIADDTRRSMASAISKFLEKGTVSDDDDTAHARALYEASVATAHLANVGRQFYRLGLVGKEEYKAFCEAVIHLANRSREAGELIQQDRDEEGKQILVRMIPLLTDVVNKMQLNAQKSKGQQ